jgi:hypothetical protein
VYRLSTLKRTRYALLDTHLLYYKLVHILIRGSISQRGPSIVTVALPNFIVLWWDDYLNETLTADYLAVMQNVLANVHPNQEARKRAADLAAKVLELEQRLNKALPDRSVISNIEVSRNRLFVPLS